MNFQHLLESQGLFYSLLAFPANPCKSQHVFSPPTLAIVCVKIWPWSKRCKRQGSSRHSSLAQVHSGTPSGASLQVVDLGGLGRTSAARHDSDLLGPICMSSEMLVDLVDEVEWNRQTTILLHVSLSFRCSSMTFSKRKKRIFRAPTHPIYESSGFRNSSVRVQHFHQAGCCRL